MTATIDFFYSFRSPYSYLAACRLTKLAVEFDLEIHARVVYPLQLRAAELAGKGGPLFVRYVALDSQRIAEREGIALAFPCPDLLSSDPQAAAKAEDHPRIQHLARLAAAAQDAGRGFAFAVEVSRLLWDGRARPWNEGDAFAQALGRAGCSLSGLEARVEAEPSRFDAIVEANQQSLLHGGHWGVPTCLYAGEPFFGQDRIDLLGWRLEQAGTKRRSRDQTTSVGM